MTALLDSKNIIIYGGGLGRGIARTFAREGANLHLAGRTLAPLEAVAADIAADGGHAEVAVVDALDEQAVRDHAAGIAARAGSLDVSFNLISRGDVHGTPLLDISLADFMAPVQTGMTSHFLTAQATARIMVEQDRGGVILSLTSCSAKIQGPAMGGTGSADAAMESFMRSLAAEVGPRGAAAFLASDRAAGVTATIVNVTCGLVT